MMIFFRSPGGDLSSKMSNSVPAVRGMPSCFDGCKWMGWRSGAIGGLSICRLGSSLVGVAAYRSVGIPETQTHTTEVVPENKPGYDIIVFPQSFV